MEEKMADNGIYWLIVIGVGLCAIFFAIIAIVSFFMVSWLYGLICSIIVIVAIVIAIMWDSLR